MSLNQLLEKCVYIQKQCIDPREAKLRAKEERELDEFTRQRRHVASNLREVRQNILERNELLGESYNNATTAKLSSGIRNKLKQVQADVDKLNEIHKDELNAIETRKQKGKEVKPEEIAEMEARTEVVQLCYSHIEECKRLEKSAFNNGKQQLGYVGATNDPTVTSLPDIDGEDGEILKMKNSQIDEKLVIIENGVAILKEMAADAGKEIDLQSQIIAEIDREVDKTNATLDGLNSRMKKALTGVRKGDRFIMDIILLCIVLGIAGYIYSQFK